MEAESNVVVEIAYIVNSLKASSSSKGIPEEIIKKCQEGEMSLRQGLMLAKKAQELLRSALDEGLFSAWINSAHKIFIFTCDGICLCLFAKAKMDCLLYYFPFSIFLNFKDTITSDLLVSFSFLLWLSFHSWGQGHTGWLWLHVLEKKEREGKKHVFWDH